MIRAIVTDIEGTTSSLSFVKDVLFPYARAHIADFVRTQQHAPAVSKLINDVREAAGNAALDIEGVIKQLLNWIDQDKKITPLKALQGLIWEKGYKDKAYHGHIYADALEKLRQWHQQGIALYVYSSGSVYAQKLLFAHTEAGDLTPLFSGYFDTNIGAKTESESYRRITAAIGCRPEEILFLSDIKAELDAAQQAGLQTCWLVREGARDDNAAHRQAGDFGGIALPG